ncbi:MAG: hypothetical protein WEA09_01790 [Gemmatimonadota bacterium]
MIGSLISFFVVGLVSLVVLGVILAVVGTVFSITLGIASILLFKVAPILLVGWVVLALYQRSRGGSTAISASDRDWLESGK